MESAWVTGPGTSIIWEGKIIVKAWTGVCGINRKQVMSKTPKLFFLETIAQEAIEIVWTSEGSWVCVQLGSFSAIREFREPEHSQWRTSRALETIAASTIIIPSPFPAPLHHHCAWTGPLLGTRTPLHHLCAQTDPLLESRIADTASETSRFYGWSLQSLSPFNLGSSLPHMAYFILSSSYSESSGKGHLNKN